MRLCIQFVSPARQIVKQVMAISICRGLWLRARCLCPSKDSRKIIAWKRYIILMMFFLPFLYFFNKKINKIYLKTVSKKNIYTKNKQLKCEYSVYVSSLLILKRQGLHIYINGLKVN